MLIAFDISGAQTSCPRRRCSCSVQRQEGFQYSTCPCALHPSCLFSPMRREKEGLPSGTGLVLVSAPTSYFVHPKDFSASHNSPCAPCAMGCHKKCCMGITVKIATAPGGTSASPTSNGRDEVHPNHPNADGSLSDWPAGDVAMGTSKSHPPANI